MASTLAKKPATVMLDHTRTVRDHAAAIARVTDQYFAALKRAESQYFDGIKRITDAVTAASAPVATPEPVVDAPQ